MNTMRERFDETFYEEVNSFMGTAFGDPQLDAKLKDFIEQELKLKDQEHKAELEMIESKYNDDISLLIAKSRESLENIENKTKQELMQHLYSVQTDDYYDCSIEYFIKDQADILKIKIEETKYPIIDSHINKLSTE